MRSQHFCSQGCGGCPGAYDKLIREAKAQGGISNACINKVGTSLEFGLNAYVWAYNVWNSCINATYCTFNKGTPELKRAQENWAKAGDFVDRADTGLDNLRP